MRTIICGSRHFGAGPFSEKDYDLMKSVLANLRWKPTEVVCGMAKGADTLGESWAKANNIPVAYFPANWAKFGRAAGPKRNKEMADYAEACVAFLFEDSRGTANMIKLATKKGIPVCVVYCDKNADVKYYPEIFEEE